MALSDKSSRRDTRYEVKPGEGVLEFVEPRQRRALRAPVRSLSVSGMSFGIVIDDLDVEPGTLIGCKVRIGARVIRGDFNVRNRRKQGDMLEYGGLFYPHGGEGEQRWMQSIGAYETGSAERAGVRADQREEGIYLRCDSCYRACWVEWSRPRGACVCGRKMETGPSDTARPPELSGDLARQLGQQHDVDLPSAYSILAGLMTLQQAMEMGHASFPACKLFPTASDQNSTSHVRYDPAFKKAVAARLLSPIQAFERGKRTEFAQRIAERHSLDLTHAYEVADNRISLLAAVRRARDLESAKARRFGVRGPVPDGAGRTTIVTVLLVVAMALAGWKLHSRMATPSERALPELPPETKTDAAASSGHDVPSALRSATRVVRDDHGEATRVVGPDPRSVLMAACEALSPDNLLQPLEVKNSFPPATGSRLGTIRDVGSGEILVLHLRRDRSSGRWFVGDGASALTASRPAPAVRGSLGLPSTEGRP